MTRSVRDLAPGDEVASLDDPRVWSVVEAGPSGPRKGMWHVAMTSPGRDLWSSDYHPDEEAPLPRKRVAA